MLRSLVLRGYAAAADKFAAFNEAGIKLATGLNKLAVIFIYNRY
jgi:hypothetical protein